MKNLEKQHQFLEQLIHFQIQDQFNEEQTKSLYIALNAFLTKPDASDYVLELIAVRIIKLSVDYEAYVSALIFKTLPDECTKAELLQLEEEFYHYIEKELYGKGLDKRLTQKLIEQIIKQNPKITHSMAEKKVLCNWGWLLPHALTQLVMDKIIDLLDNAKTEANRGKKKGRSIRIKKMD
ncbi:MAG: hypothetical protein KAI02_08320 [Gammaproteobacteria bacterium]|nr:hypothetical protein [Gammaproteobacteria bacterium]